MITEILGADDFPAGARYATFQLLGKGLMPGTNQGLTSANTSVMAINGRNWLRITGTAAPWMQISLLATKITLDQLKTRKVYGGFRYVVPNNAAAKANVSILRFNLIGPSASINMLYEDDMQRSTDEVYIKFCLDVANLQITAWIDGILIRTTTLTAAQVLNITDVNVLYGQLTSAVTTENHCYNDFYWEVDTNAEDGSVAGKLGPVKVRTTKTAGSTLPSDWAVSDGSSPDAVFDGLTMAPTTELTPYVRTAPSESVATIGIAKPAAELAIKAVSIEVFAYRDSGTMPSLQVQLKQGSQLAPKKTLALPISDFNRGASSDRLGCFNADLNGAAWTNDSIDALEVLLNSKTGS